MPANRSLTPHEAVEVTARYLADGNKLHASPEPDLPMLKAQPPRIGGVDNDTHEVRLDSEPSVYFHDNPRTAFIIAAIAFGRDVGLGERHFAVDGERDRHQNLTGKYNCFASEPGKRLMAPHDGPKKELTIYVAQSANPDAHYDRRRGEWVARSDVKYLAESNRLASWYLIDAFGVTTDFFDLWDPAAAAFEDLLATDDPRVPDEDRLRFARYYAMLEEARALPSRE